MVSEQEKEEFWGICEKYIIYGNGVDEGGWSRCDASVDIRFGHYRGIIYSLVLTFLYPDFDRWDKQIRKGAAAYPHLIDQKYPRSLSLYSLAGITDEELRKVKEVDVLSDLKKKKIEQAREYLKKLAFEVLNNGEEN